MFLPFTITKSVVDELVCNYTPTEQNNKHRRDEVKQMLENYLIGDGKAIDGSLLQSEWFPIDSFPYNVFISHSHNDYEEAKALCVYLEQECGLVCFVDEYAWNSADELLKQIDNKYCKIREWVNKTRNHYQKNIRTRYDYKKRNLTTSHIHAMLSMAILEIMDKTECIIFIDSEQSTKKNIFGKWETLSPWLYEETRFMRKLKPRVPERLQHKIITKAFTSESLEYVNDARTTDINIRYKIDDMKEIDRISLDRLIDMGKHTESCSLDNLYKSSKYFSSPAHNGHYLIHG